MSRITLHQLMAAVVGLGSATPIVVRMAGSDEEHVCRLDILGLNDPKSEVRIVLTSEAPPVATDAEPEEPVPEEDDTEIDTSDAEGEGDEEDAEDDLTDTDEGGDTDPADPDNNGEPGDQFADLDPK